MMPIWHSAASRFSTTWPLASSPLPTPRVGCEHFEVSDPMNDDDYNNTTVWELPLADRAELELRTEWSNLSIEPVEPGQAPRLELSPSTADRVDVRITKSGNTVRVELDPHRSFNFFGSWECRATVYVPRDVRAHIQTNAGSVTAHDLQGCELGIKANAGKIDLSHVHGVLHLAADPGRVGGRDGGGNLA